MAEMRIIVQKIDRVEGHDNADRLEIAFTDIFDWPIIVGKGTFKPGDKVIHFPVDCVVDEKMEDILLGDSQLKLTNGRIRATKIRGVVSYGILCPLEKIKEHYTIKEGSKDLMKALNCTKFEPFVKEKTSTGVVGKKTRKRQNRNFDKYFNMNHLQNCKGIFKDSDTIIVTEKLHGTSFRAGWVKRDSTTIFDRMKDLFKRVFCRDDGYEFVYGSRNVQLQNKTKDTSIYKEIVEKYHLRQTIPKGIVVYGEVVGPGIQKNYKYTDGLTLWVYDIKDNGEYLSPESREDLCWQLGLTIVPVLVSCASWEYIKDKLMDLIGLGSNFDEVIEGLVIETHTPGIGKNGRKKVKFLNPEFLLNKNNTDFH